MFIDIIYLTLLAIALIKGFSKGVIVALFSVLAVFIGFIAALKLSGSLAVALLDHQSEVAARWAPMICHILVFLVVVIIVRITGKVIRKSLKMVMMGWADKLGGALLYGFMLTFLFSAFLWLGTKMSLLKTETIAASRTYFVIAPVAPVIAGITGRMIPLVKFSYDRINDFFEQLDSKLNQHVGAH